MTRPMRSSVLFLAFFHGGNAWSNNTNSSTSSLSSATSKRPSSLDEHSSSTVHTTSAVVDSISIASSSTVSRPSNQKSSSTSTSTANPNSGSESSTSGGLADYILQGLGLGTTTGASPSSIVSANPSSFYAAANRSSYGQSTGNPSKPSHPSVTAPPQHRNSSALPLATLGNVTYATSCNGGDDACASTCGSMVRNCAESWRTYTFTGSGAIALGTYSTESTATRINYTTIIPKFESTVSTTWIDVGYTRSLTFQYAGEDATRSTWTETYTTTIFSTSWTNPNMEMPPCASDDARIRCDYGCVKPMCTISGGRVELLYWPVATTSLHVNGSLTSTEIIPIIKNGSAVETVMYKHTTLTSPSVYLEFETAIAEEKCGESTGQIGKAHTGAIIGLPPGELSSLHGSLNYGGEGTVLNGISVPVWPSASFNYTNLALTPVPIDVWMDQGECFDDYCLGGTIFRDYRPFLKIPSQIYELDPAWSDCVPYFSGVIDPPKALHQATVIAGPSTEAGPSIPVTTPASPSSPLASPTVAPTAAPVVQPPSPTKTSMTPVVPDESNTPPDPSVDHNTPDPETHHESSALSGDEPLPRPTKTQATASVPTQNAEGSPPPPPKEDPDARPSIGPAPVLVDPGSPQHSAGSPEVSDPQAAVPAPIDSPGSVAPSPTNAVDVLAPEVNRPPPASQTPPAAIFTGMGGESHTAMQHGSDIVIDRTATVSQGVATSYAGVGHISVGPNGIDVDLGNDEGNFVSFTADVPRPGGSPTARLIAFEGKTYTLVQSANSQANAGGAVDPVAEYRPAPGAVFSAGGTEYTAIAGGNESPPVIIGQSTTRTVVPGSAITLGGDIVSAGVSGDVVVNGQELGISGGSGAAGVAPDKGAVFTVDGVSYTAHQAPGPSGAVIIVGGGATRTLAPGFKTTIGAETVSAGTDGRFIAHGADRIPVPNAATISQGAVFAIDGQMYTAIARSTSIIIYGADITTTLAAGFSITMDGQVVSIDPAQRLVVGTQTVPLSALPTTSAILQAVVTLGGEMYTATLVTSNTAVIDGTTVYISGPAATILGATVSLAATGLIVATAGGASTVPFTVAASPTQSDLVLTLGSEIVTAYRVAAATSLVVVDGTTLTIGGKAETINGELVSVASNGVVEGGTTIPYESAPASVTPTEVSRPGSDRTTSVSATGSNIAVVETGSSGADALSVRMYVVAFSLAVVLVMLA